ncbi:MAG: hypothetical protein WCG87_07135 [Bacteroidota bacterium]
MKKTLLAVMLLLSLTNVKSYAQQEFGNTLNLGAGIGYGGAFILHGNYEFQVAKSFTIAPFVTFISYSNNPYYSNLYYHEIIIPIGAKGSYYFDDLLDLNTNWDLYAAASIGFAIRNVTYDNGYVGDKNSYLYSSPLFLDLHVGAEYHISSKIGAFLDLSTGISTIGIAIHGTGHHGGHHTDATQK